MANASLNITNYLQNNGIGRFTLASLLLAAILKLLYVPRIHSAANMGLVLRLRLNRSDLNIFLMTKFEIVPVRLTNFQVCICLETHLIKYGNAF